MAPISLERSHILLLSGTANRPLAEEVAQHLGQPLCKVTIKRFADGEIFVKIDENVRGRDVYIIQPTNPPADNLMELLLLMDAAKRASAARACCCCGEARRLTPSASVAARRAAFRPAR